MLSCIACENLFSTVKQLERHVLKVHSRQCPHCKKYFKNANTLRSHKYGCKVKKDKVSEENHDDSNKAQDSSKSDTGSKKGKVKTKSSRNCEVCGRHFESKGGYYRHKRSHSVQNELDGSKDESNTSESVREYYVIVTNENLVDDSNVSSS